MAFEITQMHLSVGIGSRCKISKIMKSSVLIVSGQGHYLHHEVLLQAYYCGWDVFIRDGTCFIVHHKVKVFLGKGIAVQG